MVSKASDCATKVKNFEGEQANEAFGSLSTRISQLKKQIQATRFASIKGKLRKNGKNLEINTSELVELATSKKDLLMQRNGSQNMLSLRSENPLCKLSGFAQGSGEKDNFNNQEVLPSTIIKLPFVEKIPPYTTWIFLDKNQRMAEDQSVVGRRQIYYDQYGGETLICSDSEEEFAEPEGKHEFSEGEDQMLWKVSQEYGLTQEVLKILSQFIEATSTEIQDRCNILVEKYQEKCAKKVEGSGEEESERSMFLDKSLNMALDSFDNLFCRRCLVFDCRLHGCSQSLVTPSEKQPSWFESEENGKPCGDQCYLRARKGVKEPSGRSDNSILCRIGSVTKKDRNPLYSRSEEPTPDNLGTGITPDERCSGGRTDDISSEITVVPIVSAGAVNNEESISTVPSHENLGKRKVLKHVTITVENSKPGSDDFQDSAHKKQKKIAGVDVCYVSTEGQTDSDLILRENIRNPDSGAPNDNKQKKDKHVLNESVEYTTYIGPDSAACDESDDNIIELETNDATEKGVTEQSSGSRKGQIKGVTSGCEWKPLEKELYLKGKEIFGRNSCLIARNLLSGLKTCIEVSMYMCNDGGEMAQRTSVPDSYLEDTGKADTDYMEQEMPTRTRLFRRRGRARKLKYTWKSAGHPSIRKRIADGKHQSCKQYTPCGCQFNCGKLCPCLRNGTCCEKYCGCSKGCKNRFRGCHCAKSQCRSRQCPCFAAGRECDPDVCRNCWISCGDGSLGEPPARGDGYQCGNMKLLLKQQQRILLAKSDVAGWGAFLKNPVNKNDYLGEYTGELISHREADKRGKIYDRANSSFLFDLNDQYVLDAYRKGDKLKFANHSSNPNCYAKVMLVAGDHRVGIFAKEHIEANEELFYDYRYCPDQAPVWARKPGSSKKDDSSVSNGRAQKHQSH